MYENARFGRLLGYVSIGFVASLCFFISAGVTHAATLSLSPSSGSYSAGDTLTVSILVSSTDQAINAASGTIHFPEDVLQVLSISKANSILTLWVQEPSFSNTSGTVDFAGVVPNPGYTGSGGNLITVRFRARSPGTANLTISPAETLANDGSGTNVLAGASGATITITSAKATIQDSQRPPAEDLEESAEEVESDTGIQPPIITSSTKRVPLGGAAEVTGSSIYPGATAELTLQGSGGIILTVNGSVGENGVFSLTQQHSIIPGEYIGSVVVHQGNAQSSPSEPFVITFEGEPFLSKALDFLMQPMLLITYGFIAAFGIGLVLGRYFFRSKKLTVNDALYDVDVEVHKSFLKLRERINQSIAELQRESENRELTDAEARFIKQMTGTIKDTEKAVEKDIHQAEH